MNKYYPETASSHYAPQWEAASVASHCSAVSDNALRHPSLADQITQPERLAYILSTSREEVHYDPQQAQIYSQFPAEPYKPAAVYHIAQELALSKNRSFWKAPAQIATMLCIAGVTLL